MIDTTSAPPAASGLTCWPASFRGVGLAVVRLPDGTFQGWVAGGYCSVPYVSEQDAIADVTAWILAHMQKGYAPRDFHA